MTMPRLAPLVLLLLALPAGQAQLPTPTSAVEVTLGDAPGMVAPGGNVSVPVTVELNIRNIVCAQDTAVTVDVAYTATPAVPGLTATLAATSLEYVVPTGQHTGGGYTDSQDTTLDITLAPSSTASANQTYTVTASFGGGAVCTSVMTVPAAEGSADYALQTEQPAAPPGEDGEDGDGDAGGGGGGGGKGMPGPSLPLVLVGLAALAVVLRRR